MRKWRFCQPVGDPLSLQKSEAVLNTVSDHLPTFFQVPGGFKLDLENRDEE